MRAIALLPVLALLTACAPQEQVGPPAPSSSLTRDQAERVAQLAALTIGGARVNTFAPSGSMLPLLDSRTIAVWEPVTPEMRFYPGDVVVFDHGDRSISHTVTIAEGGYVRTRGLNNDASDSGWQRPTLRLVALVYSTR